MIIIDSFPSISEKDVNEDVLWTWVFPSLSNPVKSLVERKSGLKDADVQAGGVYTNFSGLWYYIHTSPVSALSNPASSEVHLTLISLLLSLMRNLMIAHCNHHIEGRCRLSRPGSQGWSCLISRLPFLLFTARTTTPSYIWTSPRIS